MTGDDAPREAGAGASGASGDADADGDPPADPATEEYERSADGESLRLDPRPADATDGDLGRAGWVLVAAIACCVLVVPAAIVLQPVRVGTFQVTYLVLPLVPAVALGAIAVWLAVSGRGR